MRWLQIGGGVNIRHLGLSLPDCWMPKSVEEWYHKDFDIILIGRVSDGFQVFIDRFRKEHPEVKIADRKIEDGHYYYYNSQKPFEKIGSADSREDYMALLKRSKAFIYTTPGIDGDKKTHGLSQVTPRFLEALACGCNPVMKYQDNEDTRYYELEKFGASVGSYEDFESQLMSAIANPLDFDSTIKYLSKHLTSIRAQELTEIMKGF